ncbi:hypothetical protein HK102_013814, partial [Quaeritorhiza haematococci]
ADVSVLSIITSLNFGNEQTTGMQSKAWTEGLQTVNLYHTFFVSEGTTIEQSATTTFLTIARRYHVKDSPNVSDLSLDASLDKQKPSPTLGFQARQLAVAQSLQNIRATIESLARSSCVKSDASSPQDVNERTGICDFVVKLKTFIRAIDDTLSVINATIRQHSLNQQRVDPQRPPTKQFAEAAEDTASDFHSQTNFYDLEKDLTGVSTGKKSAETMELSCLKWTEVVTTTLEDFGAFLNSVTSESLIHTTASPKVNESLLKNFQLVLETLASRLRSQLAPIQSHFKSIQDSSIAQADLISRLREVVRRQESFIHGLLKEKSEDKRVIQHLAEENAILKKLMGHLEKGGNSPVLQDVINNVKHYMDTAHKNLHSSENADGWKGSGLGKDRHTDPSLQKWINVILEGKLDNLPKPTSQHQHPISASEREEALPNPAETRGKSTCVNSVKHRARSQGNRFRRHPKPLPPTPTGAQAEHIWPRTPLYSTQSTSDSDSSTSSTPRTYPPHDTALPSNMIKPTISAEPIAHSPSNIVCHFEDDIRSPSEQHAALRDVTSDVKTPTPQSLSKLPPPAFQPISLLETFKQLATSQTPAYESTLTQTNNLEAKDETSTIPTTNAPPTISTPRFSPISLLKSITQTREGSLSTCPITFNGPGKFPDTTLDEERGQIDEPPKLNVGLDMENDILSCSSHASAKNSKAAGNGSDIETAEEESGCTVEGTDDLTKSLRSLSVLLRRVNSVQSVLEKVTLFPILTAPVPRTTTTTADGAKIQQVLQMANSTSPIFSSEENKRKKKVLSIWDDEADRVNTRIRAMIAKEIFETEVSYVRNLLSITKDFLIPLQQCPATMARMMTMNNSFLSAGNSAFSGASATSSFFYPQSTGNTATAAHLKVGVVGKTNHISNFCYTTLFEPIQDILALHKNLVQVLDERIVVAQSRKQGGWNVDKCIADVFMDLAESMVGPYHRFVERYDDALTIYQKLAGMSAFKQFLAQQQSNHQQAYSKTWAGVSMTPVFQTFATLLLPSRSTPSSTTSVGMETSSSSSSSSQQRQFYNVFNHQTGHHDRNADCNRGVSGCNGAGGAEIVNKRQKSLAFEDLWIAPVQRPGRYVLLLKEMARKTTPTHPDAKNLYTAIIKMEKVMESLNASISVVCI